jgi:hypothetical protein
LIWDDGVFWSADTRLGSGCSLESAGKLGAVHIGDTEILQIVAILLLLRGLSQALQQKVGKNAFKETLCVSLIQNHAPRG